ncbi:MAG: ribosomal protein S18-alanine N-acetyltransferase [Gemmatimonadetes bacterium]|nr:ribosomal protein S18-alanine N-acetyltransferase [Gemmatimonadota bacterium]
MAEPFRIRPTTPDDLGALALLEQGAFSDPWTSEMLTDAMQTRGAVALVAADATGRPVASVMARAAADEGEILTIAVAPEVRGQGLGRRLLDAALGELVARGARTVWLEVRPSNQAARALYRAVGFAAAGVRRGYYRRPPEDALVLSWHPSAPDGAAPQ